MCACHFNFRVSKKNEWKSYKKKSCSFWIFNLIPTLLKFIICTCSVHNIIVTLKGTMRLWDIEQAVQGYWLYKGHWTVMQAPIHSQMTDTGVDTGKMQSLQTTNGWVAGVKTWAYWIQLSGRGVTGHCGMWLLHVQPTLLALLLFPTSRNSKD